MPLDALLPTIDNRTFADIVEEARTRIPRYTPEWTDLNDNEPGMAMVQLLAWMTDLLIYRLGKVPAQNYIKFLELIGLQLQPAQPAYAEVTFPMVKTAPQPYVIVPAGAQVAAAGQPPVVFELSDSLIALRAPIVSVLSYDGYKFVDLTIDDELADQPWLPFGKLAVTNSALMLGFDATNPLPQVELDLAVFVAGEQTAANVSNCSLGQSQIYPQVVIVWECWNGTDWTSLTVTKEDTFGFLLTGHIHLKLPAAGLMATASFAGSPSLFWIRARLKQAGYDRSPQLNSIRTNTALVRQSQTVRDEVLGGSNGQPNQSFVLENAPVLDGSLCVEVDEGDGFLAWKVVSDFYSYGPEDHVYRADRTTGTILFGDGVNGAIPAINVSNRGASVAARIYSYGGGSQGMVGAGAINAMLSSVAGIDEQTVANLLPAHGGADEETLDQIKQRAPAQIRSRCRAVTADDFVFLAKQVAGIQRALAMPLTNPGFPGIPVPGAVTVVVVPQGDAPNPSPSDGTMRTVCAYLNARKLITTELYVVKPVYRLVSVTTDVVVTNDADLATAQDAIEQALITYFHPLRGGDAGQGWPFGGSIYFSRVFQQILAAPGTQRVESVTITLDGVQYAACTDVPISPGQLLYSTAHDIQVRYDFGS